MNIPLRPPLDLRRLALLALVLLSLAATGLRAASPPATWTTGHKKVLVIPVRFTDQAGPSDAPNASGYYSGWGNITNGTTAAAINAFFQRASYGRLSMEFTVLPEINLGVSYTTYNATYGTSGISKFAAWDEPGSFADDVRAKARQVGQSLGQPALYDSDNYDLDFFSAASSPPRARWRRAARMAEASSARRAWRWRMSSAITSASNTRTAFRAPPFTRRSRVGRSSRTPMPMCST